MSAYDTVALAPDPVLATRDALLDNEAMAAHLADLLAAGEPLPVRGAQRLGAKYRWADSLRVVYRLDIADRAVVVAARAFATGALAAEAFAAAVRSGADECMHVGTHDGVRSVVLDTRHNAVWFTFPHDRRLGRLDLAELPPTSLRSLPTGRWERSELVQYAPERSATFRALDGAGATLGYAKCYRDRSAAGSLAGAYRTVAAGLHASGGAGVGAVVPSPLAHDDRLGVLVLEPLPGAPWTALDAVELDGVAARLGAAVAAFHRLVPPAGVSHLDRLRPDRLGRAATVVAGARPDVAADVFALADRLLAELPGRDVPVLLHGDLHPKNVLVAGGTVHLIDLDQMGTGDAANDLGSLTGRLLHGATTGETAPGVARVVARAVLDGYAAAGGLRPDAPTLRWYTAAALLAERALRAVTRVHGEGLASLPATISLARSVLDSREHV